MLLPILITTLVNIARFPCILAIAVILPIFKVSLVLVSAGFENAIALEFTIDELAFKRIAIFEDYVTLAML